jgi:GTPase SAR1 family protein
MYLKLNLFKIVVTGDGRGGKTSLLRRLRGEPFNEDEKTTCGVELCTVEVGAEKWAITDLTALGVRLVDEFGAQRSTPTAAPITIMDKVNTILLERGESLTDDRPKAIVFDCGGQRMYYSVQQLLLTESRTMYIIVVSLADDLDDPLTCDEDLKYSMTHRQNLVFWLNTIFSLAPGAKIIVVCTKVDRLSEDSDKRQERLAKVTQCVKRTLPYARGRIAGVLPVSSKTGEGFHALRSKIEELRPTLYRYGEPVPACWFMFLSIAQELVKQGLQRISYTDAQQIARECGIHVEKDVRAMLQRFNDAGLLVWQSNETQVLVILDTAWLKDLMTKVTCTRHIKSIKESIEFTPRARDEPKLDALLRSGRLSKSILDLLWPMLSPDERPTVLQYLVTFGVCSKLRRHHATSAPDTYLVPALFPKPAQPELSDEFASWPELRIPFRPTDCEPDIQELRFLPDTLFLKIVARLLQQVDEESSQRSELFIDRVEVHMHDTRFILHHSHPTETLTLKAFPGDDGPRIALGRIRAILDGLDGLDGLAHQYHLKYFLLVKCKHRGRLDYYEIRDQSIRILDKAKIWLQEPLQPERDQSQFSVPTANLLLDGNLGQYAAWKPVPEGKRFHFFLSHKQQGADGYAALVKEKLKALGYSCWIDTEQTADREGMEAGVKGSVCVLLFLFKGTLDRPYCRFELRLARAYGVPVIALLEGDHFRETYSSVLDLQSAFDKGELPADLKPIVDKADFNFFYRRQRHEHTAMISRLCEKLEAAMAPGDWPSFTQAPDASGEAVGAAYRILDEENRSGVARPTSASLAGQLLALPAVAGAVLVGVREVSKLVSEAANPGKHKHRAPPLTPPKEYHFFICHHQGSGSDQAHLLCEKLKSLGYKVWYDNGVQADARNLQGMQRGVRSSACLLLLLTGRKENAAGVPDSSGVYEGPFTSWYCHHEMATARSERLPVIGVMEVDERYNKADLAEERHRARTGGANGGPITPHAEDILALLDGPNSVMFLPFRRQQHETEAMLAEICSQYVSKVMNSAQARLSGCACLESARAWGRLHACTCVRGAAPRSQNSIE